jgi:SOS-response transcriptional repressor LexA
MEKTNQLTSRQRMVLNTIQRMTTRRGFGPTIREIAEAMDINSPNGVVVHLRALEKKGFIRRNANLSRSIQLVERKPTKRQKGLPLVGQVAAGPLTEAVLLGTIAARCPVKKLAWDAPNLRIPNHPRAQSLLSLQYRPGWEIS